jgi:hypothetical protein
MHKWIEHILIHEGRQLGMTDVWFYRGTWLRSEWLKIQEWANTDDKHVFHLYTVAYIGIKVT